MKITYKGDYALKSILDLAYQYGHNEPSPLPDISKRQDVPEKYLEQIMLILKKAGVVRSKRGKGGGFLLARDPKDLTVGEIVRIIDGPVEPIACANRDFDVDCQDENQCAFRELWAEVSTAISDIVDNTTFAGLMRKTTNLRRENNDMYYI